MAKPRDDNPKNNPGNELRIEMTPRLEVEMEYLHPSRIDEYFTPDRRIRITPGETGKIDRKTRDLTARLKDRGRSMSEKKKDYLVLVLIHEFIPGMLEVSLEGAYEYFRRVVSGEPYNTEEPLFFYRGDPNEMNELKLRATPITGQELEVSGIKTREKLSEKIGGRLTEIANRTDREEYSEEDYYHSNGGLLVLDPLLELRLRNKRNIESWKKLVRNYGVLAVEIPECFEETK